MTADPSLKTKPRKERKENADKRRQQLLEATLRSIATNGLAKTTLATVAAEAGLSQGVAVFYFKSKTGLLAGALQEQYRQYHAHWNKALAEAADDPLEQLIALIEADFSPQVCNPQALSIWFAFWGELKFTPQYQEVAARFDQDRLDAIHRLCAALLPDETAEDSAKIAEWIDTLTDGYWQSLHIFPKSITRPEAVRATLTMVARLMPHHAARINDRA